MKSCEEAPDLVGGFPFCTRISAMRNAKKNVFESMKDVVLGYAVIILSFLVSIMVLWVIIALVRVAAG